MSTYLLDTSGSMVQFKQKVEKFLKSCEKKDNIYGTKFRITKQKQYIKVISESNDKVPRRVEFRGSTPMAKAVYDLYLYTSCDRIKVVTDEDYDNPERLGKILDSGVKVDFIPIQSF